LTIQTLGNANPLGAYGRQVEPLMAADPAEPPRPRVPYYKVRPSWGVATRHYGQF
jgi:hypothetical protein